MLLRHSLSRVRLLHVAAALVGGLTPGLVQAQQVADSAPRLRAVTVVRADIFDSIEARAWYRRLANQIHVRTQQRVVERELLLHPGDRRDSARVAETARNLRRLQVFRDVSVDSTTDPSELRIITRDGWTTKPYATFRSTGTQRLFSLGLLETNFLGLAAILDARYVQDPDRSLLRLAVGAPRIFSNRFSAGAFFNRLSDGNSEGFTIEQPFFSLSSRNAARVSVIALDGRVLRFRDGVLTPVDSLQHRYSIAEVGLAHAWAATPRGFLRTGARLQLRREDYAPRRDVPVAMGRSVTGAVTAYVDASRARYIVTRNYRQLVQQEDVDLSTTVRVGLAVAPSAFGYTRSGAGPVLYGQTGVVLPHGFALVTGRANGIASGGVVDSGSASVTATLVLQPHRLHTVVVYSMRGWSKNQAPGDEFDLGLQRGPRAFPLHAYTGDRQRFSMVEYRFTPFPNLFDMAAAGIAVFGETGGAWFAGSRPRDGSDAGIGLRFSPVRSAANIGATRLDFVHRAATDRVAAGWVFVVGTGFTFDLLR